LIELCQNIVKHQREIPTVSPPCAVGR